MPKPFELPESQQDMFFHTAGRPNRKTRYECLKNMEPWRFVPLTDFKCTGKNLIAAAKHWAMKQDDRAAVRGKLLDDGSVVLQMYELDDAGYQRRLESRSRQSQAMADRSAKELQAEMRAEQAESELS